MKMETLRVRIYGDPVLRQKSKPVSDFDRDLYSLLDAMTDTMVIDGGVGLSAQQVGITDAVMVVNPEPSNDKTLIQMVNPRILSFSRETSSGEEGCLSFPGIMGSIVRSDRVEVEYFDRDGKKQLVNAEGLTARIIQHEFDHLNGVLFIDRMSVAKRMLLKPKLLKLKKVGRRER
jgi:peptide deformylase